MTEMAEKYVVALWRELEAVDFNLEEILGSVLFMSKAMCNIRLANTQSSTKEGGISDTKRNLERAGWVRFP
jgi:hypothetical protein